MVVHDAPLAATIDDLRRDRVSIDEYLDTVESRVDAIEPKIESLVPEEDRWSRLRTAAADLEARFPDPATRPPLYGVPIGVKDIFHVDGLPTRAGSDVPPDVLAGEESAAVQTLREAGALVLGKTVTAEFAYFEPGPTRNPHNPAHTPGGSSSGSAAAVAAGLCPFAFGTQTIGSVTRPAAFCGIVGVKPSFGRISTDGVIPCTPSVDHVGFFTQDTVGAAVSAALLCDEWQPLPTPRDRPTLGVPEGPYLQQASDVGLNAFEEHVSRLERAGYDVERIDAFEDIDEINSRHERLVAAEFALTHEEWYSEHPDGYADASVELLQEGREVSTGDVAAARRGRNQLRSSLHDQMRDAGVDLLISPSAPGPAPEGIDSTGDPIMNLPWTHAGLPTVSLPAGTTDNGLPLGLQCAAPFGDDESLLAWAHDIADSL